MTTNARAIDAIKRRGISFEPGLSDAEFDAAEQRYGFQFPSDLRAFLSQALPVGRRFPRWRDLESDFNRDMMEWPLDGILFDIENADFWMKEWGPRPTQLKDRFEIARHKVETAPTLIPVYSHRYHPDEPQESGNPIFSVYQTDIIYYGENLLDYLANEFVQRTPDRTSWELRRIRFWSKLVDLNGQLL